MVPVKIPSIGSTAQSKEEKEAYTLQVEQAKSLSALQVKVKPDELVQRLDEPKKEEFWCAPASSINSGPGTHSIKSTRLVNFSQVSVTVLAFFWKFGRNGQFFRLVGVY